MKSSRETSAQRRERLAAEKVRNDTKLVQDRETEEEKQQAKEYAAKQLSRRKRKRGLKGGGREGLMWKGSNVGVQK